MSKGRNWNPITALEAVERAGGRFGIEVGPAGERKVVEIQNPIGIKTWGLLDYLRLKGGISVRVVSKGGRHGRS